MICVPYIIISEKEKRCCFILIVILLLFDHLYCTLYFHELVSALWVYHFWAILAYFDSKDSKRYVLNYLIQLAWLTLKQYITIYHIHTFRNNTWYLEEEPENIKEVRHQTKQLKQSNQLLIYRQDHCKLEKAQSNTYQNKTKHKTITNNGRYRKQWFNNSRATI